MAGTLRVLPNRVTAPGSGDEADRLALADQARLRRYQECLDWYGGRHWARERRGRTNLVLNYARAIVDKGVSYLLGGGLGFAVEDGEGNHQDTRNTKGHEGNRGLEAGDQGARGRVGRAQEAERLIYRVYEESELEATDVQAATNGSILGDAVYKVLWDRGRGLPRVVNQDPMRFFCQWAEDDISRITRAHCVYALSREEAARRYGEGVSGRAGDAGSVGVVESWTDEALVVWVGERRVLEAPNPYGFIPFVHIPNARPANEFWGVSDLRDVIPLNRELNERFSDMADVIRFHADPPVVFKGVSEHTEMAVGPGTTWNVPADADVFLLEWRGQQPAAFEHVDRVMRALHDVAETPKTAFGETGRLQSGVALQMELQSLIQKTMRKRAWWGAGLRRRNSMVLRIAERMGLGRFSSCRSKVIWPALVPTDQEAEVRSNIALVAAGLRSRATALDRLGTESPEEELARIESELSAISSQTSEESPLTADS
jgi:hypothetical protein